MFQCFQIAGKESCYWVDIIEVEQSNAERTPNVFENLDCVWGRLVLDLLLLDEAILVYFRVSVCYGYLRFMLSCRPDDLRSQAINRSSARIVAL